MGVLQDLVGLTVRRIETPHDYLQIFFSDDTGLNIYNRYELSGASMSSIAGRELKSVMEEDDRIQFQFDGGGVLSVGMRDDDYNGPEAMNLYRTGKPLVVWN